MVTGLPPSLSGFSHSIVAKSFPTTRSSGAPGDDGTAVIARAQLRYCGVFAFYFTVFITINLKDKLTEVILCNDSFRLQWHTLAILVDTSDTELVFTVLEKSCDFTCQALALCMHYHPVESVGVPPLNNIV